jgi:hypothetical protein
VGISVKTLHKGDNDDDDDDNNNNNNVFDSPIAVNQSMKYYVGTVLYIYKYKVLTVTVLLIDVMG